MRWTFIILYIQSRYRGRFRWRKSAADRSLLYGLSDRYGTGSYRKSENEYYFYIYALQGVIINLRAARNCGFIKLTINLNSLLYMEIQRVALFSPCRDYMRTLDRNLRDILRGCPTRCTGYFHVCAGRFQCERSNAGPARLYRAGTQRRCAERF